MLTEAGELCKAFRRETAFFYTNYEIVSVKLLFPFLKAM